MDRNILLHVQYMYTMQLRRGHTHTQLKNTYFWQLCIMVVVIVIVCNDTEPKASNCYCTKYHMISGDFIQGVGNMGFPPVPP